MPSSTAMPPFPIRPGGSGPALGLPRPVWDGLSGGGGRSWERPPPPESLSAEVRSRAMATAAQAGSAAPRPPKCRGAVQRSRLFLRVVLRWCEDHQHVQVLGDVEELVLLAVVDRHHTAGADRMLLIPDAQLALTAQDEVHLVGRVRMLVVLPACRKGVQTGGHAATFEELHVGPVLLGLLLLQLVDLECLEEP